MQEYIVKEVVKQELNAPYSPEQNKEIERFYPILMSWVQSNLAALPPRKTLYYELIKTAVYLKNQFFVINRITFYQHDNHVCLNFNFSKVVRSQAWVQIPKKRRVKLDICSWQKSFTRYESTNQYQVYNLDTEKTHIMQDPFANEDHVYHQKFLND